jgi:hypothetical protein
MQNWSTGKFLRKSDSGVVKVGFHSVKKGLAECLQSLRGNVCAGQVATLRSGACAQPMPTVGRLQQLELLQQQFAPSSKTRGFPTVFAILQQLQRLQRLLEGTQARDLTVASPVLVVILIPA